jgi:serine/threonine-protein kinase
LAKVPEERPASARDLAELYQAALAEAEQPIPDAQPAEAPPDTVPETPSPLGQQAPDDPNAIAFYLEAWMPEAIAVHKLRGFVHDAKGEVVQSVPGLIRVRLGGQGSRYRFRSRRKSWFDLAPKSGLTDMALYMAQAGPSASLLHITVQMRSRDGIPASDEDFQAHCNEVFVDLRGYLMAQNVDVDDSNS